MLCSCPSRRKWSPGSYPYVHRDDPLDTAMRHMADAGVETLPVVSRSDLGKVVGVISKQDALRAYGFGAKRSPAAEPPDEFKAPFAKLAVVVAVTAGGLLLAVSLGWFTARSAPQAHESTFRWPTNWSPNRAVSRRHRAVSARALHLAQRRITQSRPGFGSGPRPAPGGRPTSLFTEILRGDPTSGGANLGLAEVYAGAGEIGGASAIMAGSFAVSISAQQRAEAPRSTAHMELVSEYRVKPAATSRPRPNCFR